MLRFLYEVYNEQTAITNIKFKNNKFLFLNQNVLPHPALKLSGTSDLYKFQYNHLCGAVKKENKFKFSCDKKNCQIDKMDQTSVEFTGAFWYLFFFIFCRIAIFRCALMWTDRTCNFYWKEEIVYLFLRKSIRILTKSTSD